MTTYVTDESLGRLARQQCDLFRRVREGTLSVDAVSAGLQALIEGRAAPVSSVKQLYPTRDYSRYSPYLHSLANQLELLRDLNRRMPKRLRVSDERFIQDTPTGHDQRVENLEFFFVVLDSPEQTWAYNQKLVELTQPVIWDSGFDRSTRSMRLHRTARRYEPGVHRIRINLVDNWDPQKGRTIDQVRDRAVAAGKVSRPSAPTPCRTRGCTSRRTVRTCRTSTWPAWSRTMASASCRARTGAGSTARSTSSSTRRRTPIGGMRRRRWCSRSAGLSATWCPEGLGL